MWIALKKIIGRFGRDTNGTGSVEVVLLLPMLLWTYAAAFVFYDGYNEKTLSQKAAYTVSDLFSRATDPVTNDHIDGAMELYDFLAQTDAATSMRVTSVLWNKRKNKYVVKWSKERGLAFDPLRTADLVEIAHRLPTMFHRDTVVLVETHSVYSPVLDVGWNNLNIDSFVYTRPRFVPRVLFQN